MEEEKDIQVKKDGVSLERNTAYSIAFRGDKKTFVLYNKTEKIVTALYLVTNFFPEKEPLVSSVRSTGIEIMSLIASLPYVLEKRESIFHALRASVLELVSYCDIAQSVGYLSSMNASILRSELLSLVEQSEDVERGERGSGVVLAKDLFTVEQSVTDAVGSFKKETPHAADFLWEGRDKGHSKGQNMTNGVLYKKDNVQEKFTSKTFGKKTQDKRTSPSPERKTKMIGRTEVILGLFKQKDKLSVKDVSAVIKDCGEKTLQRELLSLVEKGVLRKEGERRWSTYILA